MIMLRTQDLFDDSKIEYSCAMGYGGAPLLHFPKMKSWSDKGNFISQSLKS